MPSCGRDTVSRAQFETEWNTGKCVKWHPFFHPNKPPPPPPPPTTTTTTTTTTLATKFCVGPPEVKDRRWPWRINTVIIFVFFGRPVFEEDKPPHLCDSSHHLSASFFSCENLLLTGIVQNPKKTRAHVETGMICAREIMLVWKKNNICLSIYYSTMGRVGMIWSGFLQTNKRLFTSSEAEL